MNHDKRIAFLAILLALFSTCLISIAVSDIIIFHNGDIRIGDADELSKKEVSMTKDGVQKIYKSIQIKEIIWGATSPDQIPGASPGIALASLLPVTLPITHRKEMSNHDGRTLTIDTQRGFDVAFVNLYPKNFAFYNRRGSFLRAGLINNTTKILRGITFRTFFFDQNEELLSTKDFYVRNLMPADQTTRKWRIFEINLMDVPYERVSRIRIVNRF